MAGMAWIKAHPTVGTTPWAASLGECCVVKDPRRKKKREMKERGGCISLGKLERLDVFEWNLIHG
jgi:hypothetical protein